MKVIRIGRKEKVLFSALDHIPIGIHFCEICGTKNDLTGHHIHERKNGGTDDLTNLMCLCNKHHKWIHKYEIGEDTITKLYFLLIEKRKIERIIFRLKEERGFK